MDFRREAPNLFSREVFCPSPLCCRRHIGKREDPADKVGHFMDRAEQGLRMCRDGRGLESNLVSFSKGFSKRPHILAIIKVDSEYLRFSVKLKVDYFILYSILVSTLVIFLLLFSMNKRRRTNESSL